MNARPPSRDVGSAVACAVMLGAAVLAACTAVDGGASSAATSAAAAPSAESPSAALDRLDARTPVPLLPMMANHQKENMRDHLSAVQEMVVALGANDFEKVERASARVGFSEGMGQMCRHMGAGAPGFTDQALAFHHTADRIGEAARAQDGPGVLRALGDTLATCTACHAGFKQQLVHELPAEAVMPER